MPAILVLDLGEALALDGASQDHGRAIGRGSRALQRHVDLLDVVAVDHHGLYAERLGPAPVGIEVPTELSFPALAEAIDIDNRGEVGQAVKGGLVESLPDRALADLGVAAENPDVVGQPVQLLAGHRDADRDWEALPERTGGYVNPRKDRSGVTL